MFPGRSITFFHVERHSSEVSPGETQFEVCLSNRRRKFSHFFFTSLRVDPGHQISEMFI